MSSAQATVSKILTYSCVDGPGNRLVIFLQGCNFNCATCHNPHTIGQCNHCGDCIPACHAEALSLDNGKISFDPLACDSCDVCTEVCPINANPMVRQYGVAEILQLVRKHRPMLSGITVSGGEPTRQIKFVFELFKAVKADKELAGLSCFIDSNGYLGAANWERLLPVTDGVMLDVKAFNDSVHEELTGKRNSRSLQSARILHAAGKLYELRFLLIPGVTTREAELDQLIEFAGTLGDDVRIRLNAFQHHGVRGKALQWEKMTKDGVEMAAERLRAAGISNVTTPAVYV